MVTRQPFDLESYVHNIQTRPCFICELIAGNPEYGHHVIYEDEKAIIFLNKYPTLYGSLLVAPRRHREQVTGDFSLTEYLALQQLIYHMGETLRLVAPTERLYILSLGSQQGNRHAHWHLAPLPPGTPFEAQQCEALTLKAGVLQIPEVELAALAARLRDMLARRLAFYAGLAA
jgi:diadenosine tetraphosphate (Ap4A) HIT family hydrolase